MLSKKDKILICNMSEKKKENYLVPSVGQSSQNGYSDRVASSLKKWQLSRVVSSLKK